MKEHLSTDGATLFSRRQLMGRVGKGAVAAGVVAWVTPEILIAQPAGAWTTSEPPQCQDKDGDNDDCDPSTDGGDHDDDGNSGGNNGDSGGNNGNNGGNTGDHTPQSSPYGGSSGGANNLGGGVAPQFSAAGGSGSIGSTLTTAQGPSGSSLPFTGSNLAADAGVGATLVGGGWLLTRWAARRARPLTDTGGAGEDTDK